MCSLLAQVDISRKISFSSVFESRYAGKLAGVIPTYFNEGELIYTDESKSCELIKILIILYLWNLFTYKHWNIL